MITPLESMLQGEIGEFTEEQHGYLKLMYDNSQRLLKLVNELLDFSKLEAGKMKLFYQEVDFPRSRSNHSGHIHPLRRKKQDRPDGLDPR